ncbi:MAG: DEAD/DEAH box helicase family protein [Candidatus Sulfotelmatobacter sp.]
MELKNFQQNVLDTLDLYLDELRTQLSKTEKIRLANEKETDLDLKRPIPPFSNVAWEKLKTQNLLPGFRSSFPYSARIDGTGNDVPNICLKIPTGGGKTLLAAYAVSRIMGKLLQRNYGFVLWVMPNEAIFSQTRKQLTNREHPYRQILDRAAAGRVKILEKNDPLNKLDVDSNLCVMLLMLQSAARESKENLRLFRDRGNVHGFFPVADDVLAQFELLGRIPNLDCYGDPRQIGATAYESLGNVLRVLRPVIVMDEGHKSYTSIAMNTLFGFNPQFVLELSATPKDRDKDIPPRHANWLVNVGGAALQSEEMIKLPINVKVKAGSDWKDCLRESHEHLNILQSHADTLRANTSRYVRPILLVQVERTGKEQREKAGKELIHAEDAREFLLCIGVDNTQIAVKTSETNELKDSEGRDIDLLSPTCPVRVIITKQALQEGWDCPFAYVLCALAASKSLNAMTQLVGRILRQPDTIYTHDPILDECYIFCHHAKVKEIIEAIKEGLEQDGLGDLADQVRETKTANGSKEQKRKLQRREKFRTLDIYLPLVNWVGNGEEPRLLDYERDVLSQLDWNQLNVGELAEKLAGEVTSERSQMLRVSLVDGAEFIKTTEVAAISELVVFDPVYATRSIVDIVPNPWMARTIVGDLLAALRKRGFSEKKLGEAASYILEELRKWLQLQRDLIAERRFTADVRAERIQFRLRADRELWHMPKEMPTDRAVNARQLVRNSGVAAQKSLFSPVYDDDFNNPEREFACYLDEREALHWWHRNIARGANYSVQGWKKGKVYPDFIFAHARADKSERILVWEMKGLQLEGNLDTEYKRKLLETVTKYFRAEHGTKAGTLELVGQGGESVLCELVLIEGWQTKLENRLAE